MSHRILASSVINAVQPGVIWGVAFSPNDCQLVSSNDAGDVTVWNIDTQKPALHVDVGIASVPNDCNCAFSADGTRIFVAASANNVLALDAHTGTELLSFNGHLGPVHSLTLNDAATRLITASEDSTVRIWDAETAEQLHEFEGHRYWVRSAAFDGCEKRVVSGGCDPGVRIWDSNMGQLVVSLGGPDQISSVDVSDTLIASGDLLGRVYVWSRDTYELRNQLLGHAHVNCVQFSPDGKHIATAGGVIDDSHDVAIWDAADGNKTDVLVGHSGIICDIAFSNSGNMMATCGYDDTIRLWAYGQPKAA